MNDLTRHFRRKMTNKMMKYNKSKTILFNYVERLIKCINYIFFRMKTLGAL